MDIVRVDPQDDRALRSWYAVQDAAWQHDHPQVPHVRYEELAPEARQQRRASRGEYWLLLDDGRPVGSYHVWLPLLDNRETAELRLAVLPGQRRRGHGGALLDHARTRLRADGRCRVMGEVTTPVDCGAAPGSGFAASVGARMVLAERHRALDLATLDATRLAALGADARSRADGYRLVQWTGPCPDDLLDDYAALVARMSTDAPLDDLDWEPEVWDAERIRERERGHVAKGRTVLVTAVRHEQTGRLVAFSDLAGTVHDAENAFQWDTLVTAEHRGHRLGMLAKLANLDLVRRVLPAARRVHTWNADSNSHMVAINEALGFRPVSQVCGWQLELVAR